MVNAKLSPYDRSVLQLAEAGILTDANAPMYAAAVATLQNMGLIVRQADGTYATKAQTLRPDGFRDLNPPKPPGKKTLGIRLDLWVHDALNARGNASEVARKILEDALRQPADAGATSRGRVSTRRQ